MVVCDNPFELHLVLIYSIGVFLLQAGFLLLEAGYVRKFAVTNILFKNVYDTLICSIVFAASGYAFAFGGESKDDASRFIGNEYFFLANASGCVLVHFVFQAAFACTAVTILSGALAERCSFITYTVYSVVLAGFVYPLILRWTWSEHAWLADVDSRLGFKDFAGSGVVHLTGATAATVGAVMLGPRAARVKQGKFIDLKPHSTAFIGFGSMLLYVGFLFFNGGSGLLLSRNAESQAQLADSVHSVALAIVNTVLAAAAGALSALATHYFRHGYFSLLRLTNGLLAGCVAICASAGYVQPWAALIIGAVAGLVYYFATKLIARLKIDDALDAIPVHGAGGLWGVLAEALFNQDMSVFYHWDKDAFTHLGWQVLGAVVIMSWTDLTIWLSLYPLQRRGLLRVSKRSEALGIDLFEHQEAAWNMSTPREEDESSHLSGSLGLKFRTRTLTNQEPADDMNSSHSPLSQHQRRPRTHTLQSGGGASLIPDTRLRGRSISAGQRSADPKTVYDAQQSKALPQGTAPVYTDKRNTGPVTETRAHQPLGKNLPHMKASNVSISISEHRSLAASGVQTSANNLPSKHAKTELLHSNTGSRDTRVSSSSSNSLDCARTSSLANQRPITNTKPTVVVYHEAARYPSSSL
eukprot:m.103125 g.103125  ORF g.103125 m.103125 type:complete len:639 (+) comp15212_c0_seq1:150-2066(+)